MRNVHDVGGQLSWGPVPRDEEVFHAGWERMIFGLTLAVIPNGFLNNVDENRYAKERMRPQDMQQSSYFELWLAALEVNLVENGVLTLEELEAAEQAALAGEVSAPAQESAQLTEAIDGMITYGGNPATTKDVPRRFTAGDTVRVEQASSRKHSRVPAYALGRRGLVTATWPAFPVPQVVAHGLGDDVDWCYSVRFEAATLWGVERPDGVYLDVWECDLQPAEPDPAEEPTT